jgi:outer membrane cobalamin receptor
MYKLILPFLLLVLATSTYGHFSSETKMISSEEIEELGATLFSDVFADTPQVGFIHGPRNTSSMLQIRGVEKNSLIVDGARISFYNGKDNVFNIDPNVISFLTVHSGATDIQHSYGTVGGVVKVDTFLPKDLVRKGKKTGAKTTINSKFANSELSQSILAYGSYGAIDVLVNASNYNSGEITQAGSEKLTSSEEDILSALLKVGVAVDETSEMWFSIHHTENSGITPINGSLDITDTSKLADKTFSRNTFIVNYDYKNKENDKFRFSADAYYNQITTEVDPLTVASTTKDTLNSAGFNLLTTLLPFGNNLMSTTFQAGVEYFTESLDNGDSTNLGGFFRVQFKPFRKLYLLPSLRYDSYNLTGDITDSELSKSISGKFIVWDDSVNVFVNYTETFSPPPIEDPSSNPQDGKVFEVGTSFSIKDVNVSYAEFVNRIKNYRVSSIADDGVITTNSISEAKIWGSNVSVDYKRNNLQGKFSYTHTVGSDLSSSSSLTTIPEDELKLSAKYFFERVSTNLGYEIVHALNGDHYFVNNIFATFTPSSGMFKRMSFLFRLNNVLDDEYVKNGSTLKAIGRNIILNASYRF